jgi:transposase-like protein
MITALRSQRFTSSVANDWFCELRSDRPKYDCPNCKQQAMQFYAQIPGEREREDAFRCCACGSTWEL